MSQEAEAQQNERVLRAPEVMARLGIAPTTLWRWVKEGVLIPPVRVGKRAVGWREASLNAWIRERGSAR